MQVRDPRAETSVGLKGLANDRVKSASMAIRAAGGHDSCL